MAFESTVSLHGIRWQSFSTLSATIIIELNPSHFGGPVTKSIVMSSERGSGTVSTLSVSYDTLRLLFER